VPRACDTMGITARRIAGYAMERIFAWIVDRLRWLFVAANLGGVALD
jgi:hypothetical protein